MWYEELTRYQYCSIFVVEDEFDIEELIDHFVTFYVGGE